MNSIKLYRKLRGGIWLLLGYAGQGDWNNGPHTWVRIKKGDDINDVLKKNLSTKVLDIEIYGSVDTAAKINYIISLYNKAYLPCTGNISDGYHTFDELYEHRNVLFINLLNGLNRASRRSKCWKSKFNADGSQWKGWFVAGISFNDAPGYITYHIPMELWDLCRVPEMPKGEWDGHTSEQVAKRLRFIIEDYHPWDEQFETEVGSTDSNEDNPF